MAKKILKRDFRKWRFIGGYIVILTIVIITALYTGSRQPEKIPLSAESNAARQAAPATTIPLSSIQNNVSIGAEYINVINRNISLDDCLRTTQKAESSYPQNNASNQGENVEECDAFGSYRLFVVSYDFEPRSWITIQQGERIWTMEKEIVYEPQNQFGYFPNVSGNAELVTDAKSGNIIGLIVPVEAQDEEDYEMIRHQYFVIRFSEQGPCFAGRSEKIELARQLVTSSGICKDLDEKTQ